MQFLITLLSIYAILSITNIFMDFGSSVGVGVCSVVCVDQGLDPPSQGRLS